jgi:hypothetical protein
MIKHNLKNQQKHQFRSTICEPRTWPARVSSHEPSWHSAVQPSTLQAGPLAAWGQFLNRTAFLPPRHPLNPPTPEKFLSPLPRPLPAWPLLRTTGSKISSVAARPNPRNPTHAGPSPHAPPGRMRDLGPWRPGPI